MVYKSDIIYELENKIQNDYKIILCDFENIDLLTAVSKRLFKKYDKFEIWSVQDNSSEKYLKCISRKEMDEIMHLYYLYEFTDDILFLTQKKTNYPNIFNYIKSEILTEEEVCEALLN